MTPSEWEVFVWEWASGLKSKYSDVFLRGGAGDKGRDIVAHTHSTASPRPWHNFQCKHYGGKLSKSDLWPELGKLCYYSYSGEYECVPEEYYFVAPQGLSQEASDVLKKPADLRDGLLEAWEKSCATKITAKQRVELTSGLRKYIRAFDFRIVREMSAARLIDEHRATRWHVARFGNGLPPRPSSQLPPGAVQPHELPYVDELLAAYAECLSRPALSLAELPTSSAHASHLKQSRLRFYSAESLAVFARETLPDGTFEDLQQQVYDGIFEDLTADHPHGYARALATVRAARSLQFTSHPLHGCIKPIDQAGVCHQLVNRGDIKWVRK